MDGVVNVLKPPGMSSSNAVFDVRRIFSEKRAGHLGTLDPGAAGVLPICIGRATRLFDYLVDKQKTYVFEMCFGAATDTQDAYGAVLEKDGKTVTRAVLEAVLPSFSGEQMQTAPAYSALKVDGRKMYDLARAGEAVPEKVRPVTISELKLIDQLTSDRFLLSVTCSRGTYVRTLCVDIAKRLHRLAYLSMLMRTASGPFEIGNAFSIAELEALKADGRLTSAVVDCETSLGFLPALSLSAARKTAAKNALATAVPGQPDGDVRLYAGEFLGIGHVENASVKLRVHLYRGES